MTEKSALIVDDSATARIMLARVLNSMGVAVKQSKSGEDALKFLTNYRPDLIFLDHLMPGMDGFQTLKALKSNPATRDIPVVMYTSQSALRYQEEAKALGAVGVVTKQVDREQLYLLVERIWMQHEISAASLASASVAPEPELVPAVNSNVTPLRSVRKRPAPIRPQTNPTAPITQAEPGQGQNTETPPPAGPIPALWRQRLIASLVATLALFSAYAIYSLDQQRAQIDRLAAQMEASRHVMQEVILILERYQ